VRSAQVSGQVSQSVLSRETCVPNGNLMGSTHAGWRSAPLLTTKADADDQSRRFRPKPTLTTNAAADDQSRCGW